MNKAIIVHGWSGSPEEPMLKWIREQFESKGFNVVSPFMPNPDEPEIEAWVKKLEESAGNIDEETYLVGHSLGCQTILRYLERLPRDVKVGHCILIAPWIEKEDRIYDEGIYSEEEREMIMPWIKTPINLERINHRCDKFVAIFSDNDSYVPLNNVKIFEEKLGAKTLVLKNRGHFDPDSGADELPEILDFIE